MASERVDVRVRVIGSREAVRDLLAVDAAARGLSTSVRGMGTSFDHAHRRGFLMNQTLFTMRRIIYSTSLAFGALGAAALYSGYKFNASVERTTVALDYLGKGQFDATEQTKEFLRIARETAFLPQQVIDAGQSFIAFGFTAEETNRTLRATGDAIAALNLPQETIHRIIFALGQIRVKGRVMGEELRQLANANIPAYQYLADALGTNVTQLNKIGDARISAQVGIEAIVAGLEKQYGGASKRIRETTTGQMEILKGDLQAIFGGITKNLFDQFGDALRRITPVTGQLFNMVLDGNAGFYAMVEVVDDATSGAYHLETALRIVHNFLRQTADTVAGPVFDAFKNVAIALALVTAGLLIGLTYFQQLFDIIPYGEYVIQGLVYWYTAHFIITGLTTIATGGLTRALIVNVFWKGVLATWTKRLIVWLTAEYALQLRLAAATALTTLALMGFSFTTIAIIAAILALIGVLVYLYVSNEGFRQSVNDLARDLEPVLDLLKGVASAINDIAAAYQRAKDVPFLGKILRTRGLIDILGWGAPQGGGAAATAVGAQPIVTGSPLTGMQQVQPQITNLAAQLMGGQQGGTIVPAPVNIDGKQVAEIVFQHQADRMARR